MLCYWAIGLPAETKRIYDSLGKTTMEYSLSLLVQSIFQLSLSFSFYDNLILGSEKIGCLQKNDGDHQDHND